MQISFIGYYQIGSTMRVIYIDSKYFIKIESFNHIMNYKSKVASESKSTIQRVNLILYRGL